MSASTYDRNANGLTYEEWLGQAELPEGFRSWNGSWSHWRGSHPLGWAIACYKDSREWRKLEFRKNRKLANAKKKQSRALGT